ncbi:MAG TPA: antitoxin [Acidobacteriota bacterium]|jgi:hypothetical protein|nr:antitoxin [Acidobacteriota bacterium]
MSKRLQVLLEEPELREIRRLARQQHMTVAEWVRQALRAARRREPDGNYNKKLKVIRDSSRFSYPAGDIDEMLAEIEKGYAGERRR